MRGAMRSSARGGQRMRSGGAQMKRLVSIAAMMLSTGCVGVGSDARPAMCDWMVHYSREMQKQAADELEQHDLPTLRRLIEDYGELRARMRAVCR